MLAGEIWLEKVIGRRILFTIYENYFDACIVYCKRMRRARANNLGHKHCWLNHSNYRAARRIVDYSNNGVRQYSTSISDKSMQKVDFNQIGRSADKRVFISFAFQAGRICNFSRRFMFAELIFQYLAGQVAIHSYLELLWKEVMQE